MAKKLKKTSSSSSSYFPPEIIEIILSKLSSVKSLLRFKAVSKSWNTMISDPVFVGNHLQSSNTPNNNLFLRMHANSDVVSAYNTIFSVIKFEGQKTRVVEPVLKKPYLSKVLLCECNGVLLLTDDSKKYGDYVLWNPSTQEQLYFECPYYQLNNSMVNHGIFYDPITDDFKVVMIGVENYAIYSCNNNSWTIKKLRTVYYGTNGSGIFVDGATFWIMQDCKSRQLIVYFDPETEELKHLCKPNELMRIHFMASLGGRLCLFYKNNKVQILIKEKGVLENYCWNECITIENLWVREDHPWMFSGPVCYVGNKIVIRLNQKRLVYYCPSEKTLKYFEDTDMCGCKILPYRNSLYFPSRKGGNIGPREAMAPKRF